VAARREELERLGPDAEKNAAAGARELEGGAEGERPGLAHQRAQPEEGGGKAHRRARPRHHRHGRIEQPRRDHARCQGAAGAQGRVRRDQAKHPEDVRRTKTHDEDRQRPRGPERRARRPQHVQGGGQGHQRCRDRHARYDQSQRRAQETARESLRREHGSGSASRARPPLRGLSDERDAFRRRDQLGRESFTTSGAWRRLPGLLLPAILPPRSMPCS
jgi:hypothetical protein